MKKIVILISVTAVLAIGLTGYELSKKTQFKIDQYEEALRYNYTSSYTTEAFTFSQILQDIAECDVGGQSEVSYLKGKINGFTDSNMYDIYRGTYDLCEDKMKESKVPREIKEPAENFCSAYWEYLLSLNNASEEHLAQLLHDAEFKALNEQLQKVVTESPLIIDLANANDSQTESYTRDTDTAVELLVQLQAMTESQ